MKSEPESLRMHFSRHISQFKNMLRRENNNESLNLFIQAYTLHVTKPL